jgi:cytoskeletal protein CcmA (bactofilin family)
MRLNVGHERHSGDPWDRPSATDLNKPKARSRSVLECSVRLTGDLWSEGDVQIDGHLCGNISCVQLIVGKGAAVTGVIIAQEAVIRGKTTGIIRATRVLLQETAQVESEVIYKSLMVDEGARFEGIARPTPNPLEEDFALSVMQGSRLAFGAAESANANGTVTDLARAGQAGPPAPVEARQQLPAPTAVKHP